ncbi:SDR family NAD(P)-dependent oxidoreductase [Mycolicibacterium porcinum]|uniref:SDR family oxidoreductase n=1 Tax=Mycolicibacterium porcinum TaxID=39693 RepID=A0AAW5SY58_9MYCO|nr:SDR family oxidoreductase [Mycolicibacterium porcinum]MCV7388115.1 SDR family oxidoreductase [Mycolicibacterium porcinum]ORB43369.1 hypothetical protein BST41_04250 [Mycolicibacterium porcinum]
MNPASDSTISVVVGATSGIGREVAIRLARRGRVAFVGRRRDVADELAREIGPAAVVATCDLSERSAIDQLARQFPRLGALVVTAAASPQSASPEEIIQVNLAGLARIVEGFGTAVADGSVGVCFSTITAHRESPSPELLRVLDDPLRPTLFDDLVALSPGLASDSGLAYRISKVGARRLCDRKAVEWGARGGRFVCVTPGVIETPMTARSQRERPEFMAELTRSTPLGRIGRPQEIAAVVDFLCSPEGSYVTGSELVVDGGYLARQRWNADLGKRQDD